jgi:nitroreductase
METWDAIRARRNVRRYADRPLAEGALEQILEAGRRAPSSRNGQPWDLVTVTERARLRELSRVWQHAAFVADAAAAVVQLGPLPQTGLQRDWLWYDHGQATMAMMLAAADLGIGTGHASVQDQELARRILGHPEDRFAVVLFGLGYPADGPLRPLRRINRRPFDEVVHRERW